MKYCKGCGIKLQIEDKNNDGYINDLKNDFCKRCFQAKNYGKIENDFRNIEIKKEEILKNFSFNDEVLMIIDLFNPFESIINRINKFVNKNRLIIIVNKIDIFPKSIPREKILNWIEEILEIKKINYKKIFLISSKKNINVDNLFNYINSIKKDINVIGYSNVGKSSLISSLLKSIGKNSSNLITNSIGTTIKKIKIKLNNKNYLIDYPGFILKGSYQNLMNKNDLKKFNPKNEIKQITYQLINDQLICDKDEKFFIETNSTNKLNLSFLISNSVIISRHKKEKKEINKKYVKHEIVLNKNYLKQDIIISGIGIINLKKGNDFKISIYLPENINFNVLKSIYEK